ncbi:MAG: AAA family ATPase [Planctomycetota bacterium]
MLTRLQVKGFKNLVDIDVRFGPFTCLMGPNGVGKSNIFDAIIFLHLLTKHSIMEAVSLLRETKGRSPEPHSLFSAFGKYRAPEIRFIADLVVDRSVEDDFGVPAEASISTLRYEVAFRLSGENKDGRLELVDEGLKPIKLTDARRNIGFPASPDFEKSVISGRRARVPFISSSQDTTGAIIRVHQEGHGGRKVPAPKSSRTTLGGTATADFPTVLAVHREMESWRTLMLEPSAMRAPSLYQDDQTISSRGANLAAAVHRLQRLDVHRGATYAELANRLSMLVDDIQELRVRDDQKTETYTLEVRGRDGVFHPAKSLSDGTLRFLVLATLSLDPGMRGIVCLEEPENGIHPGRIPAIVELLRDVAVDVQSTVDEENPLRQVIVNSHSPEVFKCCTKDEIVFVEEIKAFIDQHPGRVASVRVPTDSWRARTHPPAAKISLGDVSTYLGRVVPLGQLWLDRDD